MLAGLGGVVVRTLLGRRRSGGTGREPNSDAARVRDQLRALLGDTFSLPDEGVPLGWAQSLERAQASVRDRRERERARAELLAGVAEAEGRARALIDSLFTGWDPGGDLTTALEEARTEAREAARRQEEARAARRELDRLEGEQVAAASTHEAAARKVRELEERVAALGEGDLARGVEAAATRLRARDLAAELRAELAQSGTELDPSEAPGSTDEVAQLSADEAALTETIEDLARRVRGLEKDLEHLQGRLTLGDLDGEVSALRAERDRLSRMRDRSWLLARLLAEADRRVREEHQPEVLREAGHSLTLLTGGRYDRLLVDEDGGGFHLAGPAAPRPIALASPLSTGTREQVYLALRLALLRPLEGRGESLPLSLDEVLVNWDSSRRARGLDLIAQTARQRQVFFFTCHESMASEAEERGAFRLDLPTPA